MDLKRFRGLVSLSQDVGVAELEASHEKHQRVNTAGSLHCRLVLVDPFGVFQAAEDMGGVLQRRGTL